MIAPGALALTTLVDRLERTLDGPEWADAAAAIATELRAARALPDLFAVDGSDPLGSELAPWAVAARAHATAGLAALRLIQQVTPVWAEPAGAGGGARVLVPPDPEPAMHHAFALSYTWMGARADEHTVYGPRFAVYSSVVQLPNGAGPALDVTAALRENANVIDRLCRLALGTYEAWRHAPETARQPANGPLPFHDRRIGEL